jgi:hypothetical protein
MNHAGRATRLDELYNVYKPDQIPQVAPRWRPNTDIPDVKPRTWNSGREIPDVKSRT